MKLTGAQQKVLDEAIRDIDIARKLDYPEWLRTTHKSIRLDYVEECIAKEYCKKYWEAARSGKVFTHCNSKTLYKLAEYGLIEIIEDSKEQGNYGIDTIRVLNY